MAIYFQRGICIKVFWETFWKKTKKYFQGMNSSVLPEFLICFKRFSVSWDDPPVSSLLHTSKASLSLSPYLSLSFFFYLCLMSLFILFPLVIHSFIPLLSIPYTSLGRKVIFRLKFSLFSFVSWKCPFFCFSHTQKKITFIFSLFFCLLLSNILALF